MHILIVNFGFHYMVTNVENFLDNVNRILPNQIRMLGNVFDYLNLYDCGHPIKVEDFLLSTIKFVA